MTTVGLEHLERRDIGPMAAKQYAAATLTMQ